jgi:hypothetical protein
MMGEHVRVTDLEEATVSMLSDAAPAWKRIHCPLTMPPPLSTHRAVIATHAHIIPIASRCELHADRCIHLCKRKHG